MIRTHLTITALATLFAFWLHAQPPVAPTTGEQVGPPPGQNTGEYNIVQSWELGYRFATIGGDLAKYRADINYHDGVRLLNSYLAVNSRDGHGKWFDQVVLSTHGLGGDPYESASLTVRKNNLYQYDMRWHLNEYYDPGLAASDGLHLENFSHEWQDHNLTLFPNAKFRVIAGYSRNSESGPALSTANLFESARGNVFTLFGNVHRLFNDYRVGAEADVLGFKLAVVHRSEDYSEADSPQSLAPGGTLGFTPGATTLIGFNRIQPIHGSTPAWVASLVTERTRFAVNGRFSYSAGKDNFTLDESALGTGLLGAENRLVMTYGDAQRPVTTGDVNVTLFLSDAWTVTNNTSAANTRIEGNSYFEQLDLATLTEQIVNFQFLGIRLITNSTDVHYRPSKKLDFFAGYRYSDREIRSIQSETSPGVPFVNTLNSQYDNVHAGAAGFNWLIASSLRLHVEAEIGRNDNPFDPLGEKNYHAIDSRLQYRRKSISASAGYRQNYNNNSITLTSYSAHARDYLASFSCAAQSWLAFDASYQRLHLDTAGSIAFFAGLPRATLQTGESIYVSNIHDGSLGAHLSLGKRADVYLGYSITKDVGDGRSALLPTGTVQAALYNVQTYPLTFEAPLARLTIPITRKIKWNAGYQYYGYHEEFGLLGGLQNYHANTGYTSILWAF